MMWVGAFARIVNDNRDIYPDITASADPLEVTEVRTLLSLFSNFLSLDPVRGTVVGSPEGAGVLDGGVRGYWN